LCVADTSKKIRAVRKTNALQGKSGRRVPYGYCTEDDKSVWLVDEYAADIVREIFKKFTAGISPTEIGRSFRERKIASPLHYFRQSGSIGGNIGEGEIRWHISSIIKILENPAYTGKFVALKSTTQSYKNRKQILIPEDEWVVIENHHEPLVNDEIFETAQRLRQNRRRRSKNGEVGILSGLAFCADCNAAMTLCNSGKHSYYICSRNRGQSSQNSSNCTRHSITRIDLETIVLAKIRDTVSLADTDKEKFAKLVHRSANEETEKAIKAKTAELSKVKKRVAELDQIISRIYEDHVAGKISDERFG
jgi:hypothetical protein